MRGRCRRSRGPRRRTAPSFSCSRSGSWFGSEGDSGGMSGPPSDSVFSWRCTRGPCGGPSPEWNRPSRPRASRSRSMNWRAFWSRADPPGERGSHSRSRRSRDPNATSSGRSRSSPLGWEPSAGPVARSSFSAESRSFSCPGLSPRGDGFMRCSPTRRPPRRGLWPIPDSRSPRSTPWSRSSLRPTRSHSRSSSWCSRSVAVRPRSPRRAGGASSGASAPPGPCSWSCPSRLAACRSCPGTSSPRSRACCSWVWPR